MLVVLAVDEPGEQRDGFLAQERGVTGGAGAAQGSHPLHDEAEQVGRPRRLALEAGDLALEVRAEVGGDDEVGLVPQALEAFVGARQDERVLIVDGTQQVERLARIAERRGGTGARETHGIVAAVDARVAGEQRLGLGPAPLHLVGARHLDDLPTAARHRLRESLHEEFERRPRLGEALQAGGDDGDAVGSVRVVRHQLAEALVVGERLGEVVQALMNQRAIEVGVGQRLAGEFARGDGAGVELDGERKTIGLEGPARRVEVVGGGGHDLRRCAAEAQRNNERRHARPARDMDGHDEPVLAGHA